MNTIVDDSINLLIELGRTGRSHASLFVEAADEVKRPELVHVFRSLCQQRQSFAGELLSLVEGLGGTSAAELAAEPEVLPHWSRVRAALASRDADAILLECEAAEQRAANACRAALPRLVGLSSRETVRHQLHGYEAGRETIRALRSAPAYAVG